MNIEGKSETKTIKVKSCQYTGYGTIMGGIAKKITFCYGEKIMQFNGTSPFLKFHL
jgi:hypothetical protein